MNIENYVKNYLNCKILVEVKLFYFFEIKGLLEKKLC